MKTRWLLVLLILSTPIFANEDEIDISFSLVGWWRVHPSTITMEFFLRVEDSTAVVINVAWDPQANGMLFENPFCQFRFRNGSEEILLKRNRWTNLPYRPTLFSKYGQAYDSIRTYLDFDLLADSPSFSDKTAVERYQVRVEMGFYFPDGREIKRPQGDFPAYLESDWLTLEVNWKEHTLNFVDAPIPEGN